MGTRGLYGMVIGGRIKASYSHFDSYPSALGTVMLRQARAVQDDLPAVKKLARSVKLVDQTATPTKTQAAKLAAQGFTITEGADWYGILRESQGDLGKALEVGFMTDEHEFAKDSLFCEWGYVIDLDAQRFEAYCGFIKEAHDDGRFGGGTEHNRGYYPIRLLASWPLAALPTDEDFVRIADAVANGYRGDDADVSEGREVMFGGPFRYDDQGALLGAE